MRALRGRSSGATMGEASTRFKVEKQPEMVIAELIPTLGA
jgi:hypothetical protein